MSMTENTVVVCPFPFHFNKLAFLNAYLGKELEFKASTHDPPLELAEFLVPLQALSEPLVGTVRFQRDD